MALTFISLVVAMVGFCCFFAGRGTTDVLPPARPVAEPVTTPKPGRSFLTALMRALAAPTV